MKIKEKVVQFLREEEGLTTVEYAIAGSLVGAAVIASFSNLGDAVCNVISFITDTVEGEAATLTANAECTTTAYGGGGAGG